MPDEPGGLGAHKGSRNLTGKALFITSSSRGLGLAIAKRATADGANIVIVSKTSTPHPKLPGTIHTAAQEIVDAGGKALAVQAGIRFEEQVITAVDQAVARFGGIDILVNNASALHVVSTHETDMKRYDLVYQINASGTFLWSKACLPHLKRRLTRTF